MRNRNHAQAAFQLAHPVADTGERGVLQVRAGDAFEGVDDRLAVGLGGVGAGGTQDHRVPRQLSVGTQAGEGEPDNGVKPVDRSQRDEQPVLNDVVFFYMRQLMQKNEAELFPWKIGKYFRGDQQRRAEDARERGACDFRIAVQKHASADAHFLLAGFQQLKQAGVGNCRSSAQAKRQGDIDGHDY